MAKLNVAGLSKKANDYITKNSKFTGGVSIGCKQSDGIISYSAILQNIETINGNSIILLTYVLKTGNCNTKVQTINNDHVFISLLTPEGKELKWTKKEISTFLSELK